LACYDACDVPEWKSMSYTLAVNGKPTGVQIGTNLGFYDMARYCEKSGGAECRAFFTDGISEKPQELRKELIHILADNKVREDIAACITALIDALKRRSGAVSPTQ
jgi:hypothetical protein